LSALLLKESTFFSFPCLSFDCLLLIKKSNGIKKPVFFELISLIKSQKIRKGYLTKNFLEKSEFGWESPQ